MKTNLSEYELRVLRVLCQHDASAGELAVQLKVKNSFASRKLSSLESKGLILTEKRGTTKLIKLSPASHAQNFKKLSDSRPNANIEQWLSGFALDLLMLISNGIEMHLFLEEAGCSPTTAYKTLNCLIAAGIIKKYGGALRISDSLVGSFADSYADNIQLIRQRNAKGLNLSVRVRKHVLLRTDANEVPDFFLPTGISALAKMGLEATLTSYCDFYFNLDQKKHTLNREECFIHALLLATVPQHRDMPLLEIFFAKNRSLFDLQKLKKFAKKYLVENKLNELREKADFYDKMRRSE